MGLDGAGKRKPDFNERDHSGRGCKPTQTTFAQGSFDDSWTVRNAAARATGESSIYISWHLEPLSAFRVRRRRRMHSPSSRGTLGAASVRVSAAHSASCTKREKHTTWISTYLRVCIDEDCAIHARRGTVATTGPRLCSPRVFWMFLMKGGNRSG